MSTTTAPRIKRGSRLAIEVEFELAGFDFTGVTFSAQLRSKPGGDVVATLAVDGLDTATLGRATLTLSAEGTATQAWPLGPLLGDVRAEKASPAWGPYYSDTFSIEVVDRITQ